MPVVRAARRALPAALLLALVLPAGAQAAATVSVSGSTLSFAASDGVGHATAPSVTSNGHLRIDDAGGISVTSGCGVVNANTVDCGLASSYTRVSFVFGAGNDVLTVAYEFPVALTVDGGAGGDDLYGGAGSDQLDGGSGDDSLHGRSGADDLRGGAGSDHIAGGVGADTIDAGAGDDFVGVLDDEVEAAPVICGDGVDNVEFDYGLDAIASDCEIRPPHIDAPVAIAGQPTVGTTLTRSTPPASAGAATESYTYWERCDRSGYPCFDIAEADQAASYTLTAADVGYRIQVIYYLGNTAGYDGSASDLTTVVGYGDPLALPPAPAPAPPAGLTARGAAPNAFTVAGAATVRLRGATAIVDTGRAVACPAGAVTCRLTASARPGGSSARVHGRPNVAGVAQVAVRPGTSAKLAIRLTPKAVRMLRSKHRITLSVSAVLKRGPLTHATVSFVVTVKAPARRAT